MQKIGHGHLGAALWLVGALVAGGAQAAGHARLVEAVTEPAFDKTQPVRIAAMNPRQKADPLFHTLAGQLADALTAQGFKVADGSEPTRQVVTLQYTATGTGVGIIQDVTASDSAYRAVIVTGFDIADAANPKMTWQTMMDEYGTSLDVKSTIPPLIAAGGPYYGVAKTAKGMNVASWCADGRARAGSLIPAVCSQHPDRPYDNQRAGRALAGTQPTQDPGHTGPT